jgi:phage major head subunit gpT-like protein
MQTTSNFSQLVDLDPVLSEIFHQHYTTVPAVRQMLYNVQTSDKAAETDLRVGSFADPVPFDGVVVYDTVDPDYEIVYAHEHYTRGFQVEQTMLEDMQYNSIFQQASQMGTAFARKQEKDAAGLFNGAFTASLGYDGRALCATNHPRSQTNSTSVSNSLQLALDATNLETAVQTLEGLKDDRGEEISIVADILLVPRALRKTALELTESELTPESAENAINVHNTIQTVVWPFLSDTTAWFVLDSTMARTYLKWFDRIAPEFSAEDSFDTLIRKYRGRMRYSYGFSDWRFVVGSKPSGG